MLISNLHFIGKLSSLSKPKFSKRQFFINFLIITISKVESTLESIYLTPVLTFQKSTLESIYLTSALTFQKSTLESIYLTPVLRSLTSVLSFINKTKNPLRNPYTLLDTGTQILDTSPHSSKIHFGIHILDTGLRRLLQNTQVEGVA